MHASVFLLYWFSPYAFFLCAIPHVLMGVFFPFIHNVLSLFIHWNRCSSLIHCSSSLIHCSSSLIHSQGLKKHLPQQPQLLFSLVPSTNSSFFFSLLSFFSFWFLTATFQDLLYSFVPSFFSLFCFSFCFLSFLLSSPFLLSFSPFLLFTGRRSPSTRSTYALASPTSFMTRPLTRWAMPSPLPLIPPSGRCWIWWYRKKCTECLSQRIWWARKPLMSFPWPVCTPLFFFLFFFLFPFSLLSLPSCVCFAVCAYPFSPPLSFSLILFSSFLLLSPPFSSSPQMSSSTPSMLCPTSRHKEVSPLTPS